MTRGKKGEKGNANKGSPCARMLYRGAGLKYHAQQFDTQKEISSFFCERAAAAIATTKRGQDEEV